MSTSRGDPPRGEAAHGVAVTGDASSAAPPPADALVPGSCVAFARSGGSDELSGVLIRGPAGAGKSSVALLLIGFGARLVADDVAALRAEDGAPYLWASAPAPTAGLIEARGLGVIRLPAAPQARLDWVVDLDPGGGAERLPPLRWETLLGRAVPALTAPPSAAAAAAIACLARDGALLDPDGPHPAAG